MNMFQKFRTAFGEERSRKRELDYLNEAVSLIDLESRQRQIDSGRFRTRAYPY